MYVGKTKITGHTLSVDDAKLPIVFETVAFSDNICASNVKLSYSAEVFLSPGVTAADRFYKSHGFRIDYDSCNIKKKHMADVWALHKAQKFKAYNHHLAWAGVYNVLEEYRQNIDKQNQFFEDYGFAF